MGKKINIKNIINNFADNEVKRIMKKDWYIAVNKTNHELEKETKKMYDSLIDDFYKYKTKSYIRHGESIPGTQVGTSLYRGNNIHATYGKMPKLYVYFDKDILESGEHEYQYDTPDKVFDYVMFGIRFPYYNTMVWSTEYKGKYFSYKGTPSTIFNQFYDDWANNSEKVFNIFWKQLGY